MTSTTNITDFTEAWEAGSYSRKILVEGDSWVSHPFPNVTNLAEQIDWFNPSEYLLLNLAEPGDEANSIFKAHGKQMKRLKRLLHTAQWGDKFDLVLLSAAGNDIVGPEIVEKGYIRNKKDFPNLQGRELIAASFYNMLAEVVAGYKRFLKLRDKGTLNKKTPIITHTYSYLTPRKVGTHVGPIKFNKGWIKKYLQNQNIKDTDEQYDIVVEMMDALFRRLKPLEQEFKRFLVVDTRRLLLKNDKPDLKLWADEIHPTRNGFRRLAKHIRKEAKKAGLWDL